MATYHIFLSGPGQDICRGKPTEPVRLAGKVQNDVSLNALLEIPTKKQAHRNPLEWAGAMGLHIAVLAALIIIPLYTTTAIHLTEYEKTPLVAPPAAPPPLPAAGPVAPRVIHPNAKLTYDFKKLSTPTAVPKKIAQENADAAAPDLSGVAGGVPGGVTGGQIGGVAGGAIGGTGLSAPPPPPSPTKPAPKIVRVGSSLKAPRQTYSVEPEYPTLARQTHVTGTVLVDAVIDERGNVVQARAISGHPLLIPAALRAVLQWKYEPTSLNGQPISVELQVQVHFNLDSQGR